MAKKGESKRGKSVADNEDAGRIGGGPGASDGSSGGGAGAGIPGGGTDMRTNGRFSEADMQKDKETMFPEPAPKKKRSSSAKPTQGKRKSR